VYHTGSSLDGSFLDLLQFIPSLPKNKNVPSHTKELHSIAASHPFQEVQKSDSDDTVDFPRDSFHLFRVLEEGSNGSLSESASMKF